MVFTDRLTALMGLIALFNHIDLVQSLDMAYCASINTASTSGNSSIYQSDGLCHDFCSANFAFSVLKDNECWCTDYTPDKSAQVDTSKCSEECPGYTSDTCGGDGLWGYIALDREPSGTKGSGSSSSTETSSPTVHNTVTVTPSQTVSSSSTTAVPDNTDSSTATPTVSVHTVTAGGTVSLQTVTVVPTAGSGESSGANAGVSSSQHGLSTGAAVGVAIGVFAAVAVALGAGLFFWLRRRRQGQGDAIADSPGSHRGSSAGMMSTPTTAMASVWDGDNTSTGRRNSRFMPHDPRMDPYAANIYSRFENKSHESINTLQDNHDYSRKVLRTTNPDPPDA
ncbi:uncharacterized protein F4822DRAFT_312693 [Hypoxylon trugodes]|uniref:uncharacterized protein n=1 Tax=Hypoxylon trugodes TaxID=326681 RepID=UPI0021A24FC5|nr:uncharacterized protein F4822DRAFT_312693 [Hypoxylon trugodes]KAI1386331.1 hypothetical protein F4822DRAFT_312693 [Hypoxylon trugodes]